MIDYTNAKKALNHVNTLIEAGASKKDVLYFVDRLRKNVESAKNPVTDLLIEYLPDGRVVYKVEVGTLPPDTIKAFLNDLMEAHRKHIGPQS